MRHRLGRSAAFAATAVGVLGLALTTLATPASAATARPVSPAGVAQPAAPLDDVLAGPWPGNLGGQRDCDTTELLYFPYYPDSGCEFVLRRGQFAYWIISDAVEGT